MSSELKKAIPIAFLLYGIYSFIEPLISGWLEIVSPTVFRTVFLPIDWEWFFVVMLPVAQVLERFGNDQVILYVDEILFLAVLFVYIVYVIGVHRMASTTAQKRIALSPLLVLSLLFVVLTPLGLTASERHVQSFAIGGRFLLMSAGGPSIVRKEAIQLLHTTSEEEPPQSSLPPRLKIVPWFVLLEHDRQVVILGRGTAYGMGDQFGFLIQEDGAAEPNAHYLEDYYSRRYWKLADGVYFYQAD